MHPFLFDLIFDAEQVGEYQSQVAAFVLESRVISALASRKQGDSKARANKQFAKLYSAPLPTSVKMEEDIGLLIQQVLAADSVIHCTVLLLLMTK